MTREQIRAALTDDQALVCTLFGEAANEPIHGQIAVGCVIRNRVLADLGSDQKPDWWGETFKGVCLKSWQFSCWWEKNGNSERVYALAEALINKQPYGDRSLIAELQWISAGLIGDQLRDITRGADHYITASLYRIAPPKWARLSNGERRTPVCSVASHIFFRLSQ
jgi:N-acetylmuramoyl-L-alanine amidase